MLDPQIWGKPGICKLCYALKALSKDKFIHCSVDQQGSMVCLLYLIPDFVCGMPANPSYIDVSEQ